MESFLTKFIAAGYDFVICNSAGNFNNTTMLKADIHYYPYGIRKVTTTDNLSSIGPDQIIKGADALYNSVFTGITDSNIKDRIIVVGNMTKNGTLAPDSCIGTRVDVVAPGTTILSTVPTSYNSTGYDYMSGTSMASPHVAGIIALMYQINPDLRGSNIKRYLINSATLAPITSGNYSYPIPDASNCVDTAKSVYSNMPNFYNMTGYTAFTPSESNKRQVTAPAGTLLPNDPSTFAAGFWKWGAYSDKFGVTKMQPDSGQSAIYQTATGTRIAASMYIAPEPTYDASADLKYPFAGVAVSFKADESNIDISDAATIKVRIRTQGVIRMALLNQATLDYDNEGGEPGYLFHPSDDFQDVTVSLAADQYGDFTELSTPSWAFACSREEVLKAVRGIKFEAKMSKGGYGSFEITSLQILNAAGTTVAALEGLTPIRETKRFTAHGDLRQVGNMVEFQGFGPGATVSVFDLGGKLVRKFNITHFGSLPVDQLVPGAGVYAMKVTEGSKTQLLRIRK